MSDQVLPPDGIANAGILQWDSGPFPAGHGTLQQEIVFQTRPCEVNGHQEYWRGTWHRWFEMEGKLLALVEGANGSVSYVDAYKVKFTDK